MKAINELEYILNYLEAEYQIDMQQVASDIGNSYDYIRGQKIKKKPSKKLIDRIKIKYADKLKTLSKYKASPYIKDAEVKHVVNEDAENYKTKQEELIKAKEAHLLDAQQRAKIAEAEKDRLLTIIENLTKNQQRSSTGKQ